MKIKSSILDIFKRLTTFDKSVGIITNGVDNLYPERVDRFINNSVTAKTSAKIMASYYTGKGWGEKNDKIIVNDKSKLTLQKFHSQISTSTSKQRGVYIQVNYNANFEPSGYWVRPYTSCRLGKKDDNKYNGKIGVSDDWENKSLKESMVTFINVFNNDKSIVESQVNAEKGKDLAERVKNYKGQILYVNFDEEYVYSLSQIDPVLKDCDSEAQASTYKNRSLRKGFFGKMMVVTKPLAGSLEDYDNNEKLYAEAISESKNFKKTIESFLGAENADGILALEMEYDSAEEGGLENQILFKSIDSNIDDKIFKHTEESVFNNILMAFNSLPKIIIRPESSVFGQSGESMVVAQKIYQDNTSIERNQIIQVIQFLMSIFTTPVTGLKLELLIDVNTKEDVTLS